MEWGYLWLWIILAGVFLIGEIFTAGFFLLWFGVAAGVTAIVSIFGVATTWQLVTFVVLSLGLLMISRPFADKVSGEQPAGIGANRLARIDHRFGNEGDFGRPKRFSESFAIDPVQGRVMRWCGWS